MTIQSSYSWTSTSVSSNRTSDLIFFFCFVEGGGSLRRVGAILDDVSNVDVFDTSLLQLGRATSLVSSGLISGSDKVFRRSLSGRDFVAKFYFSNEFGDARCFSSEPFLVDRLSPWPREFYLR